MSTPKITLEEIENLAKLERSLEQGEWKAVDGGYLEYFPTSKYVDKYWKPVGWQDPLRGNICFAKSYAEFIAAARNHMPALIESARRVKVLELELAEVNRIANNHRIEAYTRKKMIAKLEFELMNAQKQLGVIPNES